MIQNALAEFKAGPQAFAPGEFEAELAKERERREAMERRLNELVEENKRARATGQ